MNSPSDPQSGRSRWLFLAVVILAAVATLAVTALLVNIFERKQEGRNPFHRVVELNDTIDDPATWGKDFPLQYDLYLRTTDMERTRYGGSEGVAALTDAGRPALGYGTVETARRPATEEYLGGVFLLSRLS